MKILFAARSFDDMAGGVERMSISIMNEMVERGHEVSLFTWDVEGAKTFYAMSNKVNWLKINLGDPRGKAGWWIRIQRAYRIRKMVRKMSPDLVLAFQHGIFFALRIYTVGMGIPFIAAERNANNNRSLALIFLDTSSTNPPRNTGKAATPAHFERCN